MKQAQYLYRIFDELPSLRDIQSAALDLEPFDGFLKQTE